MSLPEKFRKKYFRKYDPQPLFIKDWLTGTVEEMEAMVSPLFHVSQRCAYVRLNPQERLKLRGNITQGQLDLMVLYEDLFWNLPEAAEGAGLPLTFFTDLQDMDIETDRSIEIGARLAESAQRGINLIDHTLLEMEQKVKNEVNRLLADPSLSRVKRARLEGFLGERPGKQGITNSRKRRPRPAQ